MMCINYLAMQCKRGGRLYLCLWICICYSVSRTVRHLYESWHCNVFVFVFVFVDLYPLHHTILSQYNSAAIAYESQPMVSSQSAPVLIRRQMVNSPPDQLHTLTGYTNINLQIKIHNYKYTKTTNTNLVLFQTAHLNKLSPNILSELTLSSYKQ